MIDDAEQLSSGKQEREQDADSEVVLRALALQFKKFALSESEVVIQPLAMSISFFLFFGPFDVHLMFQVQGLVDRSNVLDL